MNVVPNYRTICLEFRLVNDGDVEIWDWESRAPRLIEHMTFPAWRELVATMEPPAHVRRAECPKCGGRREGSILYPQPVHERYDQGSGLLCITCGRCGYIWWEQSRDTPRAHQG